MILLLHLITQRLHKIPLQLSQHLHVILLRVQQLLNHEIPLFERGLQLKTTLLSHHNSHPQPTKKAKSAQIKKKKNMVPRTVCARRTNPDKSPRSRCHKSGHSFLYHWMVVRYRNKKTKPCISDSTNSKKSKTGEKSLRLELDFMRTSGRQVEKVT